MRRVYLGGGDAAHFRFPHMDQRMKNALAMHKRQLAALEASPRPFTWETAGSIEYHRDAIRMIGLYAKAEPSRTEKAMGAR